jgi:integrase
MGKGGLRKSEALNANWSDLNDDNLEVKSGKGGKQRFVPFKTEWLLQTHGTSIVTKDLPYWNFFRSVCTEFTPHDFRSYYANRVVNMPGMSIEDARVLLGHETIETTAKYLRADKDRQRKLILEGL